MNLLVIMDLTLKETTIFCGNYTFNEKNHLYLKHDDRILLAVQFIGPFWLHSNYVVVYRHLQPLEITAARYISLNLIRDLEATNATSLENLCKDGSWKNELQTKFKNQEFCELLASYHKNYFLKKQLSAQA